MNFLRISLCIFALSLPLYGDMDVPAEEAKAFAADLVDAVVSGNRKKYLDMIDVGSRIKNERNRMIRRQEIEHDFFWVRSNFPMEAFESYQIVEAKVVKTLDGENVALRIIVSYGDDFTGWFALTTGEIQIIEGSLKMVRRFQVPHEVIDSAGHPK